MERVRVIAHGFLRAGAEEEARLLFRSVLGPTRAEEGCVYYEYLESVPGAGTFFDNEAERADARSAVYFNELWASQAAQDAHAQTPHFAALKAGLPTILDGDFHVTNLIEIDPA